jgi:hypothetical protein
MLLAEKENAQTIAPSFFSHQLFDKYILRLNNRFSLSR